MNIFQTNIFIKQVKKLHKNQKKELDHAVKQIIANPLVGEAKKGDLQGILVYKFYMNNQLTLLAYEHDEPRNQLILLSLGAHENFYRDLKEQIH